MSTGKNNKSFSPCLGNSTEIEPRRPFSVNRSQKRWYFETVLEHSQFVLEHKWHIAKGDTNFGEEKRTRDHQADR